MSDSFDECVAFVDKLSVDIFEFKISGLTCEGIKAIRIPMKPKKT